MSALSFWNFAFNHQDWMKNIENCSSKTPEELKTYIPPYSISVGLAYLIIGVLMMILYIPFIIAMSRKKFIQYSCYKIMFCISIVDVAIIPTILIFGGLQAVFRVTFCEMPITNIINCAITGFLYYIFLGLMIILAFDRFFSILYPSASEFLFDGKRVFFWIFLCFMYGLFTTIFAPATIYNVYYFTVTHDFFVGIKGLENMPQFANTAVYNTASDLFTMLILIVLYFSMATYLLIKRIILKSENISKLQRVMLFQSMAICLEFAITIILATIAWNFFQLPDYANIIQYLLWSMTHGDTPIAYYLLNASLRSEVNDMFKKIFKINQDSVVLFSVNTQAIH